jgi:hypothetical protein
MTFRDRADTEMDTTSARANIALPENEQHARHFAFKGYCSGTGNNVLIIICGVDLVPRPTALPNRHYLNHLVYVDLFLVDKTIDGSNPCLPSF